ncbi:MAG: hypothetical protein ACI4JM_03695 [Oscillospiraceae bacterium]
MKKVVFLLVFIIIAILLIVCNALGFVDISFTLPLIWLLISICNISAAVDFYFSKRTGLGISYTLFSVLSLVFLTIYSMDLISLFK